MNMRMIRSMRRPATMGWRVAVLALLAGCGSAPTHYLSLDPVPGSMVTSAAGQGGVLRVGHVTIPDVLDRTELVRHAGPDRLDIDEDDRWAAPLDDLTRRALIADLGTRLTSWDVVDADMQMPAATGASPLILVDISEFAADTDGRVKLIARWSRLTGEPLKSDFQQSETIVIAARDRSAAATAEAMSAAVGELADHIAAALAARDAASAH